MPVEQYFDEFASQTRVLNPRFEKIKACMGDARSYAEPGVVYIRRDERGYFWCKAYDMHLMAIKGTTIMTMTIKHVNYKSADSLYPEQGRCI
jgi:hypothetical protein